MDSVDFVAEADRVKNAFLDYVVNCSAEDWKLVKESDGVSVYSRRSEELKGKNMYKSEVILDAPPETVFAMVCPVKRYRPKWDTMLNKIETVKQIDSGLIVKPLQSITLAGGIVDIPDFPPNPKYVRTFQHPAGYVIHKLPEENKCKWVMLFHIDLNMYNLADFVLDKVKPTLLVQKVNSLREALKSITVEAEDLGLP